MGAIGGGVLVELSVYTRHTRGSSDENSTYGASENEVFFLERKQDTCTHVQTSSVVHMLSQQSLICSFEEWTHFVQF